MFTRLPVTVSFCLLAAGTLPASMALAQESGETAQAAPQAEEGSRLGLDVIYVTAEKRSANINDVAMSITAASGDRLAELGAVDAADLVKVVPGFTYNDTAYGNPVYTIRGIGFQETSLGASPTVSIYVDEVPIPFLAETQGASLDIERLEVLKGPQGTLFGSNSTGGALNYIAARPTDEFEAGIRASYGRFNEFDAQTYLSGPITDTLKGRIAVRSVRSSGWQESYTREDTLGAKDMLQGRVMLDWDPTDRLSVALRLSGWHDQSETPAPQFVEPVALGGAPLYPGFVNYPPAPKDNQAADWDPDKPYRRDNTFLLGSVRVDYDLTDTITLTSLTSGQKYDRYQPLEGDGTTFEDYFAYTGGEIETFFQELRLAGSAGKISNWIIGVNYEKDDVYDEFIQYYQESSNRIVLGLPLGPTRPNTTQNVETAAIFGNIDYDLTDQVALHAGVRYTDSTRDFNGCGSDIDGTWAAVSELIQQAFRGGAFTPVPQGGCGTTAVDTFEPGYAYDTLAEDNVSWRVGADWRPVEGTLLYANVSKGYKAGSYPTLAASSTVQFIPVTQESVVAYEAGFKSNLMQTNVQLNGAAFYYDYKDKQIQGRIPDPVFGPLPALVNVPESEVKGFELDLTWQPLEGLTLRPAVTYVDTEIGGDFSNYTPFGELENFTGEPFPYTPEWQGNFDAQYEWPVGDAMSGFVGANVTHRSDTNGAFGQFPVLDIDSYTLLDLRAGIASASGDWRVSVFGRNVTDEYYWTSAFRGNDSINRYTGMPATYGISVDYTFH